MGCSSSVSSSMPQQIRNQRDRPVQVSPLFERNSNEMGQQSFRTTPELFQKVDSAGKISIQQEEAANTKDLKMKQKTKQQNKESDYKQSNESDFGRTKSSSKNNSLKCVNNEEQSRKSSQSQSNIFVVPIELTVPSPKHWQLADSIHASSLLNRRTKLSQ